MAEDITQQLRLTSAMTDRLDDWRAKQRPIPSRSEAVRTLLDKALTAAGE